MRIQPDSMKSQQLERATGAVPGIARSSTFPTYGPESAMRVQVSDATARASLRDSSDYGLQYLRDAQSADSKLDSNITVGGRPRPLAGRRSDPSNHRTGQREWTRARNRVPVGSTRSTCRLPRLCRRPCTRTRCWRGWRSPCLGAATVPRGLACRRHRMARSRPGQPCGP